MEQKHYTAVRQYVGYVRLEGEEAVVWLNELYACLCVYLNFFQTVMRCLEKVREGSHVTRRYDTPQTPVQRLLASADIPDGVKVRLQERQAQLHPLRLWERIYHLLEQLERLAVPPSGRGSCSLRKEKPCVPAKRDTKRQ